MGMQPVQKSTDIDRTKNWRVLLYGKPGTGKTSSAQYLKGETLVLDLDDSFKVLANKPHLTRQPFNRKQPIEEISEFAKTLQERIKGYDNLIIDNISAFESDWFVERGRNSKSGIGNEIQDYGQWKNYFTRMITTIFMDADCNVLVTAWENLRDVTTDQGQTFSQYAPEIRDSVRDGLLGMADVVGRVVVNPKTGGRGVILQGNDGIFAKNRLDDRTSAPIEELYNFGSKQKEPTKKEEKAGK